MGGFVLRMYHGDSAHQVRFVGRVRVNWRDWNCRYIGLLLRDAHGDQLIGEAVGQVISVADLETAQPVAVEDARDTPNDADAHTLEAG